MNITKTCTICGETKPLSEFGIHPRCKHGRSSQCKKCNNDRVRIFSRTPSGVYTRLKSRSKFLKRKPIKISRQEFIDWYNSQKRECVYCGIKEENLGLLVDAINGTTRMLTIDCVVNKKGYVLNNLVLACRRCNFIKTDLLTYDEMMYVGQNFIKPKWEKQLHETAKVL